MQRYPKVLIAAYRELLDHACTPRTRARAGQRLAFDDLAVGMSVRVHPDLEFVKAECLKRAPGALADSRGVGWINDMEGAIGKGFKIIELMTDRQAATLDMKANGPHPRLHRPRRRLHFTFPFTTLLPM